MQKKQIATHAYIPWSPELHKAHEIWKYWRIQLSHLKNKRRPGRRVQELLDTLKTKYAVEEDDESRTVPITQSTHTSSTLPAIQCQPQTSSPRPDSATI
jgi:hypothetical protein